MKILAAILFTLRTTFTIASNYGKKNVHFKIHVPEIISHHIHTKTIIVHVHKPTGNPHKENSQLGPYDDNWTHHDYHGYHDAVDEHVVQKEDNSPSIITLNNQQTIRGGHYLHHNHNQNHVFSVPNGRSGPQFPSSQHGAIHSNNYRVHAVRPTALDGEISNNLRLQNQYHGHHPAAIRSSIPYRINGNGNPRQYDVYENVVENLPDDSLKFHSHFHEGGKKSNRVKEFGHLHTSELHNFYDHKHEESDELISSESGEFDETEDRANRGNREDY